MLNEEEGEGNPFGTTVDEIAGLMTRQDKELLAKLGGVHGVAKALRVDLKTGLIAENENQFEDRKRVFGINVYPEPPRKSWFAMFWEALQDTTLIILSVAAIVSLVLGLVFPHEGEEESGWVEGAAILIAVLLVATVTATNNFSKEQQFRSLNKVKNNKKVRVLRGENVEISIFDILAGDIAVLEAGDQVPADGIFIDGYTLSVDESVMTGEPDAQKKNEKAPWMISGCQVVEGSGRMIVTGVGVHSEWGRTLSKLNTESEDTPLQEKLDGMAKSIGKGGLSVAILVFTILMIYWIVDIATTDDDWEWENLRSIVDFFIIAVTIVVVAVPEGLPLAVTISLAYSMKQMTYDNNLVRHLAACETMGGATNICSDKTGTLTENRMSVVAGWIAGIELDKSNLETIKLHSNVEKALNEGISVNSTAFFNVIPGKPYEYIGNKTECALLVFVSNLGCAYKQVRKEYPPHRLWAFSSARKRMSTMIKLPNSKIRLYCKGASEIVLDKCTTILNTDGEVVPLEENLKDKLKSKIDEFADQALRTLCLAYKDFDFDEQEEWDKQAPEEKMTCIAIMGIADPLRKEVPDAVASCRKAGIFVRMVTGDNIITAKRIARECGILTDGLAIEGPDFAKLSPEELDDLLPRLQVLARSSPTDKFTLVTRLIHNGEVVAVTGDGTNDAMALKAADVGLSMGISGTSVAKEASDIVIMDDNFSSIVKSVLWGRSVYDNIRKFLQFQLTVNVVALTVAFIGALTGRGSPLRAVQLLWVNLIMDTMAALALGTERPTPDLLYRKPYGRTTPLISPIMIRNLLGQAFFQVTVLFVILYTGHLIWEVGQEGSVQHYTILFNTFVFCQVFNEINSRKVNEEFNVFDKLHTNWLFVGIILITVFLQALIVELGGSFTATTGLTVGQWFSCIGIALLSVPLGAVIRLIPIPKAKADLDPRPTTNNFVGLLQEEAVEME